jgi:hypothetical protein
VFCWWVLRWRWSPRCFVGGWCGGGGSHGCESERYECDSVSVVGLAAKYSVLLRSEGKLTHLRLPGRRGESVKEVLFTMAEQEADSSRWM